MSKLITPIEGSPSPNRPTLKYDWGSAADGEFHQWRDEQSEEEAVDSRRAYHRLKISARYWAERRGGTIRTQVRNNGRQVWIAIHLPDSGGDR